MSIINLKLTGQGVVQAGLGEGFIQAVCALVRRWQPLLSWMVSRLIHLLSCAVSSPTFHQMLAS